MAFTNWQPQVQRPENPLPEEIYAWGMDKEPHT
jgi:hypothetical protein